MSDLIERDKAVAVIDRCKHRLQGQGSTYEIMLDMIKTIPSAEPTWTDALAELHERFDALEKEIRKASAEMSAVIREYVDVQKNESQRWIRNFDGNEWYWYCSNCKTQYYEDDLYMGGNDFPNYCPNCGARMKGADDE